MNDDVGLALRCARAWGVTFAAALDTRQSAQLVWALPSLRRHRRGAAGVGKHSCGERSHRANGRGG